MDKGFPGKNSPAGMIAALRRKCGGLRPLRPHFFFFLQKKKKKQKEEWPFFVENCFSEKVLTAAGFAGLRLFFFGLHTASL